MESDNKHLAKGVSITNWKLYKSSSNENDEEVLKLAKEQEKEYITENVWDAARKCYVVKRIKKTTDG